MVLGRIHQLADPTPFDFALFPIYFAIIYYLGNRYRQRYLTGDPEIYKYYGQGLMFKLIASLAFCFIYLYFYGGGDTTGFYHWSYQWLRYFFKHPGDATQYLFSDNIGLFYRFISSSDGTGYGYLMKYGSSEVYFVKITSVINMLGLNSFLCTSLVFGYLAFLGSWRLFIVFYDMYPHLKKPLAIATLFIPSAVFWSSGIMKDTLTYMGICWLTYNIYFGLIKRQSMVKNILVGIVMAIVVGKLKGYILLSFIPAAGYWLITKYKEKISSSFLRIVTGPFFMVAAIGLSVLLIGEFGNSLGKYSINNLQKTAEGYQSWHQMTGGSSYTIVGAGDFTLMGLLKIFPQGIVVTLFRPFIFEARSIFNIMASLEGMAFMYLTLSILWHTKIVRLPEAFALDSNVTFCFMFSIILAFAVGITSFNFGALARYKIPVMPFYAIGLIIIDDVIKRGGLLGGKKS
ncbi:MAG TPA: hypothetical protein PL084_03340 [Chitinophagales bacterium]|nr:hypothetical protein [Chitinophagales bacterium]